MKVAIFGLGYVGTVSAACLAKQGHEVVGADVHQAKVDLINDGRSPIVEADVDVMIRDAVAAGRLRATSQAAEALRGADVSLICVGTPSRENGSLDLQYVRAVAGDLGRVLSEAPAGHVVAVRSTMLPGSIETEVVPAIAKASGRAPGVDFHVCINPEFLREGCAVADYYNPAFTLIGANSPVAADRLAALYEGIEAPVLRTDVRTAEMVKYSCNAFHAVKVTFANELGVLCKRLGIDSHQVMEIFCRDTKLNISPKYLKPGFAFGGSCLPKDVRALLHRAKTVDLDLPLLNSLLPSNDRHLDHSFRLIERSGKRKIGILGLSFKAGTDDLRESPMVRLVETLIGKGYDIRIYDKDVSLARLFGANRQYIEKVIPHISSLLIDDADELVRHAELVVIGNDHREFAGILAQLNGQHAVLDLVKTAHAMPGVNGRYEGICW